MPFRSELLKNRNSFWKITQSHRRTKQQHMNQSKEMININLISISFFSKAFHSKLFLIFRYRYSICIFDFHKKKESKFYTEIFETAGIQQNNRRCWLLPVVRNVVRHFSPIQNWICIHFFRFISSRHRRRRCYKLIC